MFCKTCGKEINDNAVICPYCGCSTENAVKKEEKERPKLNVLSLVGFILSLVSLLLSLYGIVAIAGLVLSIVGLYQCSKNGERLKGLAIAGIIVSAVSIVYTIIVIIYGVSLLYSLF